MNTVRTSAVHALAIIGFVATLFGGMVLAIHLSQYVPSAVNGIGSAAVSLVEIFLPNEEPTITVIDTTNNGNVVLPVATTTATTTKPVGGGSTSGTPIKGGETSTSVVVGTSTRPNGGLFGLPDLAPSVIATGIMTGTTTNTFIATTSIPTIAKGGIRFAIENRGTNAITGWRFNVILPTENIYIYNSQPQQILLPGDRIEYALGFDRLKPGVNLPISITVDSDKLIQESNENNNSAFANITVGQ